MVIWSQKCPISFLKKKILTLRNFRADETWSTSRGYFDYFSFLCLCNLFSVFLIVCVLSVGLNSGSECSLDVTKSRVLRLVQSWPVSSSLSHHFNSCSKLSSINHLMQYSLNSWTAHASGQDTNKHVSQDASKLKSVQKTENKYFGWFQNFFLKSGG